MLDFAPDGLEELSQVTRYLAGTAVAALAILMAVGFVYFLVGRNGGFSRSQEKGMKMVGIGLGSVMLLTSISAAVSWGISQGGSDMMPSEAQQQDLVVEREGSTISCPTPGSWEAEDHEGSFGSNYATEEETEKGQAQLAELGFLDAYEERINEIWADEYDMGPDAEEPHIDKVRIQSIRWHPDGANGGCEPDNYNLMPGTAVEIEATQYPNSITSRDMDIPVDEGN